MKNTFTRRDFMKLGALAPAAFLPKPQALETIAASYYVTKGFAALTNGQTIFTSKFFNVIQEGIVSLYDAEAGHFHTGVAAVSVQAAFSFKRDPNLFTAHIAVHRKADDSFVDWYGLAYTEGIYTAGFAVVPELTPDLYFKIVCLHELADTANGIKLSLLFREI